VPRKLVMKITLKKGMSRLRWVSQLMVPGRWEWDVSVLRSCLYPHNVEEVLKIRPMQRNGEDFIAWFYEKNGIFTVKSVYRLALDLELVKNHDKGSTSGHTKGRTLYQEIWSSAVPPRVRIFAWRVTWQCLSTQEKWRSRALVDSAICSICGSEEE
jgi:hypothetical protein